MRREGEIIEEFFDGFTGEGRLLDTFLDDTGTGRFSEGDKDERAGLEAEVFIVEVSQGGGAFAEDFGRDYLIEH